MRNKSDNREFKKAFKKRIYNLTLKMIALVEILPKDNITNRISDQLFRSCSSVLANYVEGLSASSKKDLANFFNHSLKSANESLVWFSLLKDSGRAKEKDVLWFITELDEIAKIFASSIMTLRGKNKK